jgi:hypothetical protein
VSEPTVVRCSDVVVRVQAFAGIVAEPRVPLDPSTVTARITDDETREIDVVLNSTPRTRGT